MNIYLLFIGIIILLFAIEYCIHKKGYSTLTLFALILTIGLVVLRYEIGYDYLNYAYFCREDINVLASTNLERGFIGLVGIFQFFHIDSFWMFFLFGLSTILLVFHGIKLYTPNVRVAFLIYLLIPGLFLNSFSTLRQSIAIAFVFNAYYYYYIKEYKLFVVFYFCGALFHYSCLAILPLFLLAPLMQSKLRLIILIGVPLSLVLSTINFSSIVINNLLGYSKYILYTERQGSGTNFIKLVVLNATLALYLFIYKRLTVFERSLLLLVVLGLILLNICSSVGAITRISYYFRIFEIVLLANVFSHFRKIKTRFFICTCVVIYYFIMFYSSLSFDYYQVDTYPKLTPYKSVLSK